MKRLLFDLEGNGLLPDITKIHCIAAVDVDTGETFTWGPGEMLQAREVLASADILIAHFGLGYDFPVLEKIWGWKVPEAKQLDTVVISRLKFPNLKELDSRYNKVLAARNEDLMGEDFGKHTIAAWGRRLGIPKLHTDIEDWSQWTAEMQERCVGDVATALKLWNYLKPDQMSQAAIELEHRVQRLTQMITAAGWPFDSKRAQELHAQWMGEKEALRKQLIEQFGSWTVDDWFTPKVNNKSRGYVAGVPFNRIKQIEFNPNSLKHIERCLKALGWQPIEFTDAGNPVLDEEVLEQVGSAYPQAKPLVRYNLLKKRLGQLADGEQAWLKQVKPDGKIHADYNPMGTVTSRASHFNPNIGQVPANASEYGKECRELFYVPEGWDEVGADMSGLEGRCFAHYLFPFDQGAYGEDFLAGVDTHWKNAVNLGFVPEGTERDKHNQLHTIVREQGAKRLGYAIMYGSGGKKAGRITLDCARLARKAGFPEVYDSYFGDCENPEAPTDKELRVIGEKAKYRFMRGIVGFINLKDKLNGSYVPGLDGRAIPIRSPHAALNTLLQSAGAILCKRWICDAYDALVASGLTWGWEGDFVFLGWIHDELQVACRNGLGDRVGKVLTETARGAGTPFKFRIALDSEYKIGRCWADTH